MSLDWAIIRLDDGATYCLVHRTGIFMAIYCDRYLKPQEALLSWSVYFEVFPGAHTGSKHWYPLPVCFLFAFCFQLSQFPFSFFTSPVNDGSPAPPSWAPSFPGSSSSPPGWSGCWAVTRDRWLCRGPTPTWSAPGKGDSWFTWAVTWRLT